MANRTPNHPDQSADERTQPAIDLAARIQPIKSPHKILDIGCGPGNSTNILAQKFPHACIIGIDSSENAIQIAQNSRVNLDADLNFITCDIATGLPHLETNYDIVFSSAVIQWIPQHQELLQNIMARLKPGGIMAIQTPLLDKHPLHPLTRTLAQSPQWKNAFPRAIRQHHNLTPEKYAGILTGIAAAFNIWETIYYHPLPSHRHIIEWFRNTHLKPYFAALPPHKQPDFEADLLKALEQTHPATQNNPILIPSPQRFITATR